MSFGPMDRLVLRPTPHNRGGIWFAVVAISPFATLGPNAPLVLCGLAALGVGISLLWRPGEPQILLYIFLFQWLQVFAGPLYGNMAGLPIDDVAAYPGRHEFASFLLFIGTTVLAIGMRLGAGQAFSELHVRMRALVASRPYPFWIRLYLACWLFATICETLSGLSAGLRQPLSAIAGVKWGAFALFTVATFAPRNRSKAAWLTLFGLEFALSIGGFFANFKDVFVFALLGLSACHVRFSVRALLPAGVLGVVLLALGLVWTATKIEYRSVVNSGSRQQVVQIDYSARLRELGRIATNLEFSALGDTFRDLSRRLMYFQFFGAAASNVPVAIPHTHGELWGDAITRPFMPRLLFPDKSAVNDSDGTNQYAGLGVASADQGTSISLGYMAEAYIDFGPWFMFLPIAALGAGIGKFYRWLLGRPGIHGVIGAAMAPVSLMPAYALETSVLKLVPALLLTLCAALIVMNVVVPFAFRVRPEA